MQVTSSRFYCKRTKKLRIGAVYLCACPLILYNNNDVYELIVAYPVPSETEVIRMQVLLGPEVMSTLCADVTITFLR